MNDIFCSFDKVWKILEKLGIGNPSNNESSGDESSDD